MNYLQEIGKKTSSISRSLASIRSFYQYEVKNKKVKEVDKKTKKLKDRFYVQKTKTAGKNGPISLLKIIHQNNWKNKFLSEKSQWKLNKIHKKITPYIISCLFFKKEKEKW